MDRADGLREIVVQCAWLMRVLEIVAELELPDGWVGAGAVRDLVWDTKFGAGFDPANIADVDVVFFDASDLSAETEHDLEARLATCEPSVKWDVKNQARVHLWYEQRFGVAGVALGSTADGVATWPEYATALAVRLRPDGNVDVLAPYGLDDLLDGIWRRNPLRVTDAEARRRLDRKRPGVRWPGVTVI